MTCKQLGYSLPLLLALAGPAAAEFTIDMEGVAPDEGALYFESTAYAFGDYLVTAGKGFFFDQQYIELHDTDGINNGTDVLDAHGPSGGINVVKSGGELFSAVRFDASEFYTYATRVNQITIVGTYVDGTTTMQQFTSDDVFAFQTFELNSSFQEITKLQLNTDGYSMAWDNIVVDSAAVVPAPPSLALLGFGSLLLLGDRFRRKPKPSVSLTGMAC